MKIVRICKSLFTAFENFPFQFPCTATDVAPWALAIQLPESLLQTNFAIRFNSNCSAVF